jgi:hypothetical protein
MAIRKALLRCDGMRLRALESQAANSMAVIGTPRQRIKGESGMAAVRQPILISWFLDFVT